MKAPICAVQSPVDLQFPRGSAMDSSLFSASSACNLTRPPSSMQNPLHHSALRLVSKHYPLVPFSLTISNRLKRAADHMIVSQSSNDNSVSLEDKLDIQANQSTDEYTHANELGRVSERELPFHVPISNFSSIAISPSPQETQQSTFPCTEKNTESNEVTESVPTIDENQRPSIVEFLKGKHIFITGATGFLAKVLVEKILRIQPDVGQLFLLIKAKDIDSAKKRLNDEILEAELFKLLQKRHGDSYKGFMRSKLTPVVGDITLDDFGLNSDQINSLSSKLEVIVHSAASTAFDERYDHAFNVNTKGPQRILDLCKRCPRLQLLLHVSTAYVNGLRKGVVHEEAFRMGHSIARELYGEVPDLQVAKEMELIEKKTNDVLGEHVGAANGYKEQLLKQAMKELGLERAKLFGWQDTYVFTKAMGEMMLENMREHLPMVILRPSIVESSMNEPFPGWMEGCRMMDPILLSYGKGQITGFLYEPKGVLDVIPVDMVVNAMLATMPHHASKIGTKVYQVASSSANPLFMSELSRMVYEHFVKHPYMDKQGRLMKPKRPQCFEDVESFIQSISTTQQQINLSPNTKGHGHRDILVSKVKERAAQLARLYKPYTFYEGRFDISNTKQIYNELSYEESDMFRFDVRDINWEDYIKNIHIPGLRKHVNKGRGSSVQ